jgi:hypothetical protein
METPSGQGDYDAFNPPKIFAIIETPERKNVYSMIKDYNNQPKKTIQ